jgi:hypothetical protein
MKFFGSFCLLIFLQAQAQEGVLDPSIFDGTGREMEKTEPQKPAASVPEQAESEPGTGPQETEETGSQAPPGGPTPEAEGTTEAPREIVLPGTESPAEEETAPPGTPANSSAQESRAGERVESTEKIVPGQAVDFPWDM